MDKKDERYALKLAKLLKKWGVDDEDAIKDFVSDAVNLVNDESDDEGVEQEPTEGEEPKVDENVESEVQEGEQEVETPNDSDQETEVPNEQEVEPIEQEQDENVEQPTQEVDIDARFDELKATNDALVKRLETLEDIISKLGVEKKEIGATPIAETEKSDENDAFNRYINKRQ